MCLLRQRPRPGIIGVVPHAVHELAAGHPVLAQPDLIIIGYAEFVAPLLLENHLVKADPASLGVDMELAHGHGLIAGLGERLCQRAGVGHKHPIAVYPVSVGLGKGPRHQAAPGRDADRTAAVAIRKYDSVPRQLINGGGHDGAAPSIPGKTLRPLICLDKKNIKLFIFHFEPPMMLPLYRIIIIKSTIL